MMKIISRAHGHNYFFTLNDIVQITKNINALEKPKFRTSKFKFFVRSYYAEEIDCIGGSNLNNDVASNYTKFQKYILKLKGRKTVTLLNKCFAIMAQERNAFLSNGRKENEE